MNKADFGPRALAWLGDMLAMLALASIISFILASAVGLTAGRDNTFLNIISAALIAIWGVALTVLQFVYFGYFWSKDGQSLGMRWLHVRVVRQDGEPLSFWRAGFRGTIGYAISALVFYVGYLWALWDDEKETWHDKLFGTWVVATNA